MKNVLIPTDFSQNAWNAIFTALKLYADMECHFYVMHAYEPNAATLLSKKAKQRLGVLYDSWAAFSAQELEKVVAYINENHHNKKHIVTKISAEAELVDAINAQVVEKPIDMVIMGSRGATAAKGVFVGSNTVKVIKKIRHKPLLVVPSDFDFQKLSTVVFPTDFSRPHEAFELQPLLDILEAWKADLKVFHLALEFELSETQQAVKNLLEQRLGGIPHSFHEVDRTLKLTRAIQDFAKEQEAQMIAIIQYGHAFVEKLTREAVVKKLGFRTNIPLLVLPDR